MIAFLGTFLKHEKLQNHSNERKGKKKRKERGEGKEEKIKNQLKKFVKLHKVSSIVKHYNMKYTLYYAHAKLKAVKGKRLVGNTGIVHLSIVRWNLLKRNIQLHGERKTGGSGYRFLH